jgi:cytochrome c553
VSRIAVRRTPAVLAVAVLLALAISASASDAGSRPGDVRSSARHEPGTSIAKSVCAACHGADGNSVAPIIPKLAGQNSEYLYRQLWAFKTGARQSVVMNGKAAPLSDADIADLAAFYSEQRVRPDPAGDKSAASLGERIFHEPAIAGPGRMPLSCATCHGASVPYGRSWMGGGPMMGMMGRGQMGMMGIGAGPNLKDQHAAYIVDQLNRFAAGARQGGPMGWIASQLNETQREAVAAYLSALP